MDTFDSLGTESTQPFTFSGGAGSSRDDAVVITAPSSGVGVHAEYVYVEQQCGRIDEAWSLVEQSLLTSWVGGKSYDKLTVRLKDGTTREFFFDISSFYGKGDGM